MLEYLFIILHNNDGSRKISGDALKDLYKSFVAEHPIVSTEDPFDQDDHWVWRQGSELWTSDLGPNALTIWATQACDVNVILMNYLNYKHNVLFIINRDNHNLN